MAPTLYTARLDSQTDDQWRRRTVLANSKEEARKLLEDRENTRAAYSISDRKPLRQIVTRRHADGVHATVNLDTFATPPEAGDAVVSGRELLAFVEQDHYVDGNGKVYGPRLNVKAHLQAHYQSEPYKIVSLEPILPSGRQLVEGLVQLHQNKAAWAKALDAMREAGIPINAVTGSLFGLTSQAMIDGSTPIVWSSATIRTSLHTVTYVPNQDTNHFFSDTSNEVGTSGTYTTGGGPTLGSKTSTYDTATDQIRLDAADFSVTGTTITARRAVVWDDTAGASTTDPVIGWVDFGADVSTTNGTFSIVWDATGIEVYDVT